MFMNRLLILDGNALLHRAYHALPPLTSPDGKPTGAVYGFISMLIRLQTDLNAFHFAIAFDRPKPTFRNELYKEYQSQRPPLDEQLIQQITTIHEVISEMNIPMFEMDGFEADDMIGTLVNHVVSHKFITQKNNIDQIIVVTGDRDILQLVGDRVLVYMPVKGLSEAKLYGKQEVIERLGVEPERIPDWKGLCGDPSDNYPGVKGIGPKTAADLVNTYKTVEEVYTMLDKGILTVSEGVKHKLLQGREDALLSKTLATIRVDAPIDIDIEKFFISTFNTEKTRSVLLKLGFPSLVKRISNNNKEISVEIDNKKEHKQVKENQLDLFS